MKSKNISLKMLSTTVAAVLTISSIAYAAEPVKKDESVYVNLTAEGEHRQTIVSDWLHSDKTEVEIKDKSILQSISNIKGDEIPHIRNGVLTWKSDKNDIYYQGFTNKDLPLDVKITYYLDGNETKPQEIAGESGHVRINLQFINKDSHVVDINGVPQNIFTPFITSAIINLPLDTFTDVKISAGEIISDANNQIVTFIGFPGLQESLGIDSDLMDLPEEVSIEAEVEDFKMGSIMIVATPQVPDMDEFEGADSIEELEDGIEQMKDASSELADGADKLAYGQEQLYGGVGTLYSGIGKLKDASGAINDGASQLAKGANDALNGSSQLSDGVVHMGQGVEQFGAAALLFGKGSQDYAKGAYDYAKGAVEFADRLAPLTDIAQKLGNGLGAMVDNTAKIIEGEEGITAGAKEGIQGIKVLKGAKGRQDAGVKAVLDGLNKTIDELKATPGAEKAVQELTAYKQILQGIDQSKDQFDEGLNRLQGGFQAIATGSEQLTAGLNELQKGHKAAATSIAQMGDASAELKTAVNKFNEGSKGLTAGANELAKNAELITKGAGQFKSKMKDFESGFDQFNSGIVKLKDGASSLYQGTSEFDKGLESAYNGAAELNHGAEELASGTNELAVNMKKFDEEAIDKLDNEARDKIDNIDDILSAKDEVVRLSKDYGTFSGMDESMEGSVKFIMKTDEIEAPEMEKVEQVKEDNEKQGLWSWIKNLFSKE